MTVTAHAADERRDFSRELVAQPSGIEFWRRQVAHLVRELGGDPGAVAVARLGVSELLSNVCKHVGDRRCRLEVEREGAGVCVRLFDRSPQVPAVRVPRWDAEEGRGLWLLREMADALGYTCVPDGKWVWFRCLLVTARGHAR
ncbi:ATP-binding protein [Streptomyces sp. XM4193]|uniref:ATP-binding protein n=1 Tax=Streptomyces sp. XM4193 TaxID=2929782 RepID=UPI001FF943B5|nr:ATP-binding protein [Streptomyces sp. XM4193]MCK1796908.1 ATP-binding protein [Streptomyces sp. XM4193]